MTLLCVNDKEGQIAAGLLKSDYFDTVYSGIVQKVLTYRKTYNKAPGISHIDDVFDDVLSDTSHAEYPLYSQVVQGVLVNGESLNPSYVLSRVSEFVRGQQLKQAVLAAADRYSFGGDRLVPDIEKIFLDALKNEVQSIDSGIFLNDRTRSLNFLNQQTQAYSLAIPELDRKDVGLTPKELMVFIAPKGSGKSWFCIHAAKMALLQRANVVHITLEMSEDRAVQRYYQSLFAVSKRDEKIEQYLFELDELERICGFVKKTRKPLLTFDQPDIILKLSKKIGDWGTRFGRIVVKQFPTKSLTVSQLRAYLDMLEVSHKFIPHILIVDYPDLMWTDPANQRISVGRVFEELRGLGVERNLAVLAPTQANRAGIESGKVTGVHVAEDISKLNTADQVLTYSQTKLEKEKGLARIYVEKSRNDEDKFTVIISQHYGTGQFALSSARMYSNYFDQLKNSFGEGEE